MFVLVINAGSSSLKYSLFKDESRLVSGIVERIGIEGSFHSWTLSDGSASRADTVVGNHSQAVSVVLDFLVSRSFISSLDEISAVGHRVVHGGNFFSSPVIIDDSVKDAVRKCIPLAPLHNPNNLLGIEACEKALPHAVHVAVFDTAFHSTIPPVARLYPLPYELFERDGVLRYGFHGTSHEFVSHKAADFLNKKVEELRLITLHLGNGCSACAIRNGVSVDTTMGFTPLEGLMMGTRSGSIDPGIILFLLREKKLSVDDVDALLNKKSGLLGISGLSNDMRDLYTTNDRRAWLAIDMFAYRVAKTVGSYFAVLGGCDAIVFTGGIGEHVAVVREKVVSYLSPFGIFIDKDANAKSMRVISSAESKIPVLVIPTDEELMIARKTAELAAGRDS
ncbi:acetate kinase [Candidatus Woesearchaeota archaeon]|nr:MAG: acetate kinase [Candidatus Woesearchaeota archaeon]